MSHLNVKYTYLCNTPWPTQHVHHAELLFPGDYLSKIFCYYQVLVEVPRHISARGIRTARAKTRAKGMATTHTPVDV